MLLRLLLPLVPPPRGLLLAPQGDPGGTAVTIGEHGHVFFSGSLDVPQFGGQRRKRKKQK